jgi:hypothetical protein
MQSKVVPDQAIEPMEIDQDIRAHSETAFDIDRTLVDRVAADLMHFIGSVRIVPHEENGRVVGMKLYGVRFRELLGKLGVQNGDLIRTINGIDVADPNGARGIRAVAHHESSVGRDRASRRTADARVPRALIVTSDGERLAVATDADAVLEGDVRTRPCTTRPDAILNGPASVTPGRVVRSIRARPPWIMKSWEVDVAFTRALAK